MTGRLLVVDASIIVEVLRRSDLGDRVAEAMRDAQLTAPAHLDAEVLSALGRLVRDGAAQAAVERSLSRLAQLPLERYALPPLLQRAWSLREKIALRDALYLACAEAISATLLTLDRRLARSAPVAVEHVS